MKPNQPKSRSRVKALSAVIGGSAIVAMGALTAAVSEEHSGTIVSDPGTFTSPEVTEMTTAGDDEVGDGGGHRDGVTGVGEPAG